MTPGCSRRRRSTSRGADRVRLRGLERDDGRGPVPVGRDERQLAERLARPHDGERRGVPELRREADGEPPLRDQVQRVSRIAAVEHDLVAVERPPAGNRQKPPDVFLVEAGEELPVHRKRLYSARRGPPSALCRVGDTANVIRVNDVGRPRD